MGWLALAVAIVELKSVDCIHVINAPIDLTTSLTILLSASHLHVFTCPLVPLFSHSPAPPLSRSLVSPPPARLFNLLHDSLPLSLPFDPSIPRFHNPLLPFLRRQDDANAEDEEAQEAEREALEALEAAMNGGDGGAMGGGGGAAVMGVGSSLLTQCLHAVDSIRAQEVFLAKQVSDVAASEPHDAQGDSFSFKRKLQQNEALLQAVPVFVDQSAAYRSRLVRVLEAEIGAQEEALDIARMSKDKCEWMMNSLERAHALVDGGGTLRKRLKVAIPTDAGDGDVASGGRHGSGGRSVGGGSQTAEDDAEEDDSDDLALYGSTGTPRGGTPRAGGGDDGEGSGSRADSGAATTPGGSKVKGNAEGSASVIGRQDASSETEWCPITRTYRRKKGSGEDDHWRN